MQKVFDRRGTAGRLRVEMGQQGVQKEVQIDAAIAFEKAESFRIIDELRGRGIIESNLDAFHKKILKCELLFSNEIKKHRNNSLETVNFKFLKTRPVGSGKTRA